VGSIDPFAAKAGGNGGDLAYGVAVDASKNIIMVGQFQNTATFGAWSLTSLGGWDGFVAKTNAAGGYKWAQRVGTAAGDDQVNKVVVDSGGNIYITGKFYGALTLGNITLTSAGSADIFIAKLDFNGNFLWAKRAGSSHATLEDEGIAITLDTTGNVYVTGAFAGTAGFGATSLVSAGDTDIFVTKLDSNGVFLAAWRDGGANKDVAKGIGIDGSGNVVVTGEFQTQTVIGSNTFNAAGGGGDKDVFVARYNNAGVLSWALRFGGSAGVEESGGVAVESGGSSYVHGTFWGTVNFGAATLTSAGGSDVFVLRLDVGGDVLWAKRAGGTGNDTASAIRFGGTGQIYTTGHFQGSVTLAGGTLNSAGASDVYGVVFNTAGTVTHAASGGGATSDLGMDLALDADGRVVIVGAFTGSATFGGTTLSSGGFEDAFVWRYVPPLPTIAICVGGTLADSTGRLASDSAGNLYLSGVFSGSIQIGSFTLNSLGGADFFVAKFNASGTAVWAVRGGSASNDTVPSLARDVGGNLYVAGNLGGAATLGSSSLGLGGFVAKLDPNGNFLWATQIGTSSSRPMSVQVGSSQVYVLGEYTASMTLGATTLTPVGGNDIYVTRLSQSTGAFVWAKSIGSASSDYVESLAVDKDDGLYAVGHFYSPLTIGSTTLTSSGGADGMVFKMDQNGNHLWATRIGGVARDYAKRVAVNSNNEAYVAGTFSGTPTYGPSTITSAGGLDMFVVKLSSSGTILWARSGGGTGDDEGTGVAVSSADRVAVGGYVVGGGTFGSFSLTPKGAEDVYLVEYDSLGTAVRARLSGGTGNDRVGSVIFDSTNTPVVSGYFNNTSTFESLSCTSNGNTDIFVWRLGP